MTNDLWPTIRALTAWLDAENGRDPHEMAMRIMKIAEEAGEASAAYIGMTGQNPRKGTTHTQADLEAELADVAVTALVALASLTTDAETVFTTKVGRIAARVGVEPEPAAETRVIEIHPNSSTLEQAVRRLAVQAAAWPGRA
ncbi:MULTISPECIES: MazG-like family protein [unclassified Streptomyces]|uniref:MazG-like family protein n=1 Tax=unclassified Streptomyces TaxID=2593676 RepID=UPI0033DF5E16